jgi:membrane protein
MGDAGKRLERATVRMSRVLSRLQGEARPEARPLPPVDEAPPDPAAAVDLAATEPEATTDPAATEPGAAIDRAATTDQDEAAERAAITDSIPAFALAEIPETVEDAPEPDLASVEEDEEEEDDERGGAAWIALSHPIEVVQELVRKSAADRLPGLAAESAFFATLSLFPGLLILAAALGWLDLIAGQEVARRSEAAVIEFLGRVLTDAASGVVGAIQDLFSRQRGGVLTSALVIGVWTLSRGFAAVIRALDTAYGLRERRSWIEVRLTAVMLALGSAIVMTVLLAVAAAGPFLGHGQALAAEIGAGKAWALTWGWLRTPVIIALAVLWTATLYHLAPNRRAPWVRDLPGALLAAALWILASSGFGMYLGLAGRFNQIFGLVGGGLILMIWLYVLSFSLLLGGELNAVLLERAGIERRGRPTTRG